MGGRQFYSAFDNKLDSKKRVSIPANFRAVMKVIESQKLVLRPSQRFPSIEARPDVYFAEFESKLNTRDEFGNEYADLAWTLFPTATEAEMDPNGRIALTPELIAAANLSSEVTLVGLGRHFEIWERAAAHARIDALKAQARAASA